MIEDIDQKILTRFEIIQKIKKTNSGIVWKAIDRKFDNVVAIKKITPSQVAPVTLLKTYRETLILIELPKHPNIINLHSVIKNELELYNIYEFVDMDLSSLIKAQILDDNHKKLILYNVLKALAYIHAGGMIHCDLSPSKILVDSECQTKLIGFGLAQGISDEQEPKLNDYVKNRWYKAPEILLGCKKISTGVDLWALGCIFAEMITGSILFPGTSTLNQLEKIIEITGKPSVEDLHSLNSEMAINIIKAVQAEKKKKSLDLICYQTTEVELDLLKKMLCFIPKQRLTLENILQHDYFKNKDKDKEKNFFYHPKDFQMLPTQLLRRPEGLSSKFFTLKEYAERLYQKISKKKSVPQIQQDLIEALIVNQNLNLDVLKDQNNPLFAAISPIQQQQKFALKKIESSSSKKNSQNKVQQQFIKLEDSSQQVSQIGGSPKNKRGSVMYNFPGGLQMDPSPQIVKK